jgi:hypothetical protein
MRCQLRELLTRQSGNVALLIGNGINRYDASESGNSWGDLLDRLARTRLNPLYSSVPEGISLTEFYDVLDLAGASPTNLQKQFCDLMASWKPRGQHQRIAEWAKRHQAPVLTTNFEGSIGESVGCSLQRIGHSKFTAYYPWESYYGTESLANPCEGFAVWHVNGMQRYRQSIRLGLTHYMGSVQRARPWLHKDSNRLLAGNDMRSWPGASTWLQIMFHKPLIIIGLKLAQDEVFLRWLFIERAKYFRRFPERRQDAWYVHEGGDNDPGKFLFFGAVGVQEIRVADYKEIYGHDTWALERTT